MAFRSDAARFGKVERTPQGFARVPARLTRVGVFEYLRADGSVRRELRPREEVFAPASLATLRAAPVTDMHPAVGLVTPRNVKALRVGGVLEHKEDGLWVSAVLQIEDADTIDAVLAKKRTENSCGYRCRTEETPGRYDAATGAFGPDVTGGVPYDAIQRNIEYNHNALLPTGAARAGSEACIKLDSSDSDSGDVARCFDDTDDTWSNGGESPAAADIGAKTMDFILDGITLKLDAKDVEVIKAALAKRDAKIGELEAGAVTASASVAALQTKLDAATSPEAVASAVAARVSLETSARKVLGAEEKFDGKSDAEIRAAVLAKAAPETKLDGKSAEFVAAFYEGIVSAVKAPVAPAKKTETTVTPRSVRKDGDPNEEKLSPRDAMIARRNAMSIKK
jgi:hypothetical protein